MSVYLRIDGDQGLEKAYIRGNTFYHNTGKVLKLFPFDGRAKSEDFRNEFRSFQGIVGESFRICAGKRIDKAFSTDKESTFNTKLKNHILNEVITIVRTDSEDALRDTIIKLFFGQDGELVKFNGKVLPFMSFGKEHSALNEMALFVSDVLLKELDIQNVIASNGLKDNLFYQLIVDSLPKLHDYDYNLKRTSYFNAIPEISELFQKDFNLLRNDNKAFLEEIENLFKYYYFFYMTQLSKRLGSFGKLNTIQPIYFTMDWESLSGSRLGYQFGWSILEDDMPSLFAHANAIELFNYIEINGNVVGDYRSLLNITNELDSEGNKLLIEKIQELITFYETWNATDIEKSGVEKLKEGIERLYKTEDSEIIKLYKRLYYTILFVLENTSRNKVRKQYSNWLIEFCKVNFTKNRGRLGTTTTLSQEMLLFLVKLCVGEEEKIRLNTLWSELETRGLTFDEVSKTEIIKLFERINLLEKKSDSGDAQYVKSII